MLTHPLRMIQWSVVCSCLLLVSCGVTHPIRVMDEDASALVVSLGGPLADFSGVTIPVPYLNAGYCYGLSDAWTVESNVHVTSLLFNDLGIDAGAATRLVREHGAVPEVTLKLQGMYFTTFNAGAHSIFLGHTNLNASYRIGARWLAYAGTEHTVQFSPSSYFFTPFIGVQFPVSSAIDLQVESKWMAANHFTGHGLLEGVGAIGSHGSVGIFVGLQYALSGRRGQ